MELAQTGKVTRTNIRTGNLVPTVFAYYAVSNKGQAVNHNPKN